MNEAGRNFYFYLFNFFFLKRYQGRTTGYISSIIIPVRYFISFPFSGHLHITVTRPSVLYIYGHTLRTCE